MVNQEIVEGIRRGLVRGETLQQAMISFHNAGYIKEDIEDAAREIQREQLQATQSVQNSAKTTITAKKSVQKIAPMKGKPITKVSNYGEKKVEVVKPKPVQKASSYGESKKKSSGMGMMVFLILLLLLLVGGLVATLLFKEQIINFFNGA